MFTTRSKFLSLTLVLLLAGTLLASCAEKTTTVTGPITLTLYGVDSSDAIAPVIAAYKKRSPTVTIKYKKFDTIADYENILINEIADGGGPDMMYVHNSWLPHHIKKLVPLTSESLTPETFTTPFVNVAADDLIQPDPKDGVKKIYALPLFVDTLALYYNQDHYEKALPEKGKPGATWADIKKESTALRQTVDETALLSRGSIALGRADSVSLAADILMNFILAGGVNIYDADNKQAKFAQDGISYFDAFLGFGNKTAKEFGWSNEIVNLAAKEPEVDAFVKGKVSAIVGYASLYARIPDAIKAAKNAGSSVMGVSDVKVAPFPQFSADASKQKNLANYYGLAVSRNSKNVAQAWDFIQYATSKEVSRAYLTKTKLPAARRDLIEEQKKDPVLSVFVNQVGSAVTVKQYGSAQYREIFNQAITKSSLGFSSRTALAEAQAKITDILKLAAPAGMYPKPPVVKKK